MKRHISGKKTRPKTQRRTTKRNWVQFVIQSVLPIAACLATIVTLVWHVDQDKTTNQAAIDSQWRSALENIDPKSAHIGALEMESFFDDPIHGKLAHTAAASLLSKIDDDSMFEVCFDGFFDKATSHSGDPKQEQSDLRLLAKLLTSRLITDYQDAKGEEQAKECSQGDRSLKQFLSRPECFYSNDDSEQEAKVAKIELAKAKLDTVTKELNDSWLRHGLDPANQDLSEIVFYTYTSDTVNYKGLDFTKAKLDRSEFYGNCDLNHAKLPNPELNQCDSQVLALKEPSTSAVVEVSP